MSFKTKIKCLFEQTIIIAVIIGILALFGIIFMELIRGLFRYFPEELYFFFISLIKNLYLIAGFILGTVLVLHIFKIRYLNYYIINKISPEEKNDENNAPKKDTQNEKSKIQVKEEKIIIRDPKSSGHNFISGLFKTTIFIIKIFVSLIALLFCMSLTILSSMIALAFLFIKTGITFISVEIMLISSIVINVIILILLYNFLINKKSNKKKMGITFAGSLITFGIGLGLFFSTIFSFNLINNLESKEYITSTKIIPMHEDTYFLDHWHYYVEYKEANIEGLRIELMHSKIKTLDIYEGSDGGLIITESYNPKLFKILINDVNNKKIIDYQNAKIKIYASKENIIKMQENFDKQFNY